MPGSVRERTRGASGHQLQGRAQPIWAPLIQKGLPPVGSTPPPESVSVVVPGASRTGSQSLLCVLIPILPCVCSIDLQQ